MIFSMRVLTAMGKHAILKFVSRCGECVTANSTSDNYFGQHLSDVYLLKSKVYLII